MDMAGWILICLFASVGLVQCGVWLLEAIKKPSDFANAYLLVPVYDEPEIIEAQLRSAVSRANWSGDTVLLVDMGLGEECATICEKIMQDYGGLYICRKEEVAEMIDLLA